MKKKREIPVKKLRKNKPSYVRSFLSSALMGLIFAGLFSGGVYVLATPPDSKYSPGDTLNPSCAVGSTNCSTVSPVPYSGATTAVDLGSQNLTTTGTTALGASTSLKYNSTNYTTLTAASNGDITIATTSATTGGNINLTSAITGDFTMLSNSGTLVLGGTGNTNNETLKLDFETYANKVAITSGTSVADIDFGSLNLATTGTLTLGGSTAGTLVTRVKAGAATESDTNGSLVVDSTNGRLYFRYGSAWHYVAQTAGFQIPDFETIDPLSGEQIKEGDMVLGMINKTFEDGALHGVWVKWDTLKAQLLQELNGQASTGGYASGFGAPAAVDATPFAEKVKNGLFALGISVKEGIATIKELATEKLSAKIAKIEQLEMVDKASGEIYCTWVENGEWQKAKGECGSVAVAMAPVVQKQEQEIIVDQVKEELAPQIESNVSAAVENQVQEQIQQEVKEEVKEQVQEKIKEQVEEKLEEKVKEEVAEQLEEKKSEKIEESVTPVMEEVPVIEEPSVPDPEVAPEPEIAPVPEPLIEPEAAASTDVVIQETAAALLGGAAKFITWVAEEFGQVLQKSVAGLMGPFVDLKDFINNKY